MNEHREKAVAAALQAAEPHLQRMFFERLLKDVEIDVLAGELRHIAEKGCVPHGLDVLTWAEGWFVQLSADLDKLDPDHA